MRKSVTSILGAALLVVGLAGCQGNDNNFDTQNDGDVKILDQRNDNGHGFNQNDRFDNNNGRSNIMNDRNQDCNELYYGQSGTGTTGIGTGTTGTGGAGAMGTGTAGSGAGTGAGVNGGPGAGTTGYDGCGNGTGSNNR